MKRNVLHFLTVSLFASFSLSAFAADLDYYVEYIESNGKQWIDTGIRAQNGVAATADVLNSSYETMYRMTILGGGDSAGKKQIAPFRLNGAYNYLYADKGVNGIWANYKRRMTLDCELRPGYQKLTVDGVSTTASQSTHDLTCDDTSTMTLFALNKAGSISEKISIRLYNCKIYTVDTTGGEPVRTLVRDFQPCVDTDGVKCLYDKVSEACFYTSGTDAFPTVGPRYNETTGKFDLTTVTASAGTHGTVSLSPSDSGVAGLYRIGETVTLTATPAAGYALAGWTGLPASKRSEFLKTSVSFTLEAPTTIDATFAVDRFGRDRTEPLRLYCAPTAQGTGDGTSWENAQRDVVEACRSVGLNPAGGEVWIKTGAYDIRSAPIVLYPNVKILGGFAGDETAASEADPEANPVLLHGDTNYGTDRAAVWQCYTTIGGNPITTTVPVVNGLELVEPPVDDYSEGFTWHSSAGSGTAILREDGCATNSLVAGIRFATLGSGSRTVSVRNADADGLVISNCTFWGASRNNGSTVLAEYCPLTIVDSTFVGGVQGVRLYSPGKKVKLDLRRCTFKYNEAWQVSGGYVAGGLCTYGYVFPTLTDCVFDHNVANANYYGPASAIQLFSNGPEIVTGRFERCTFTRNVVTNGGGVATVLLNTPDRCRFDIVDTKVVGNRLTLAQSWGSAGFYTSYSTDVLFRNCYFVRNEAVNLSSSPNYSSVFSNHSGFHNTIAFINCTVESNRVAVAAAAADQRNAATVENYRAGHFLILNSVFRDNDAFGGNTRLYEISRGDGWVANGLIIVLNSMLTHTAADYKPIILKTTQLLTSDWCFGYSYVKNLVPVTPASRAFVYDLLETEPALAPGYQQKADGLLGVRVAEDDPCRKRGVLTWTGNDGFPYLFDTVKNQWRSLRGYPNGAYPAQLLSDAQARALGLSRDNQSDPDFLGRRRPRKPTLGPVDYPTGLYIKFF